MAAFCHGNGEQHCCWVAGEVCPFLEADTLPGRHWVCGKRRELGSWQAVHEDPEYMERVGSVFEEAGVDLCGDFRGARLPDGTLREQCCYSDQYPRVHNTHGPGAARNGERNSQVGPGARAVGKSD